MFPTTPDSANHHEEPHTDAASAVKKEVHFNSLEEFSLWLQQDLAKLVAKYQDFESPNSLRDFFKR